MRFWLFALALALLPGCDVATAALILGSQDKSSSDDGPPLPAVDPDFPEPKFKAWVAQIADAPTERDDLIAANGNPDTSWTFLGDFSVTETFDPDNVALGPFNAILIQVGSIQNYDLDCVEILDANNAVVEYASGTPYSNLVNNELEILGPPDGVPAVTNAQGAIRAFIFTLYTGPIDKFRINGHPPQAPAPGDIITVGNYTSALSERPGGMAIASNGVIHLTLSVGDTARLVRYNLAGTFQDDVEISPDIVAVGNGSHSVALDSAGVIFTACSIGAGTVQVRRFETDLSGANVAGFSSGANNDRVEHNSIAVDGSGFVIVVGGMNSLLSGRNHWRVKLPDTVDILNDPPAWQSSTSLDGSTTTTYWHAVTTDAGGDIFTTGDLSSGLLGTIEVYTAHFNSAGAAQWADQLGDGETPSDLGHAIALDSAGNIYVAGSAGTDTDGKDGMLIRYTSGEVFSQEAEYIGPAGSDDEILDIAVDPADGSIYAVGYEGVAGQGENWWIRKYVYNAPFNEFNTVWTRTHHGGFGHDRAVSCAISGNNLVVAGYETNSTGETKLVLRVYEK